MASKKRSRAVYSADNDSDDDASNGTLVQEEETTCEGSGSRKKIILSRVFAGSSHSTNKGDLGLSESLRTGIDLDDDLDSFFSSSVHEVVANHISTEDTLSPEKQPDVDSSDDESEEGDELSDEEAPPSKPRYKPLDDFRELRSEFIEQFMRRYGTTTVSESCCICGIYGEAMICTDCLTEKTRCQECFVREHKYLPLHRVQYFDSSSWQKTTLRELGLIVNFGHNGGLCPASSEAKSIVVIDMGGIQEVKVTFCVCENLAGVDATERSQLINHGWFPATAERPGTVATFAVLDAFEALSGESKLSGYHFYKSLVRLKDGAGYENVPRRYEEFMRMTREYEHLKMLLRAGKTAEPDPDTPFTVGDGELAFQCPACPHPGQNIPADWEKRIDSWIYSLFIMIDANFRLKSKKKKTTDNPDLGGGSSYFVREQPYMQHISESVEEKEIKYCDSGLRAVDHANLKGGKGYNASGVVGVQCRHMLIRNNGVGDLQKGEKYANVDYVVLSSLKDLRIKRLIMSYDIICQYSRNFKKRMAKFDKGLQLDSKLNIGFVIPQFHIAGHGESCRTRYNLRFREHVGRTDGENIERGWAALNPLAMASREMGWGARHDYIDWHIGDWNYQRMISFYALFPRKLKEAVTEGLKHSNVLFDFRRNFPKNIIKDIEDAIKKWDEDPLNAPDPFATDSQGKSMMKVQKKLMESELKDEITDIYAEAASETRWLIVGLELEDKQSGMKKLWEGKKKAPSTDSLEKNSQLIRKIRFWKSEQLIHMPRITMSSEWTPMHEHVKDSLRCWKIKLMLPSSLPPAQRQFCCSSKLVEKERQLRFAQAYDSLMEIRHLLQKEWWLRSKKRKHVSGTSQKLNTRSNCAIDVVVEQRANEVARYRRARMALSALVTNNHWETQFKVLRDEDVRYFEDDEGKGEGRRSPSWIWTVQGATAYRYDEDANAYEGLRVEYAKARARSSRWLEEAQLIREEMRRVICYFNWKIGWWLDKNSQLKSRDDEAALGSIVYGNRQILILQKLGNKFRQRWQSECDIHDLPVRRNDDLILVKNVSRVPRFCNDD